MVSTNGETSDNACAIICNSNNTLNIKQVVKLLYMYICGAVC